MIMDSVEYFMAALEQILDTKQKRHILGGMLLSMSFLFGGLALTVMTLRLDEVNILEQKDSN